MHFKTSGFTIILMVVCLANASLWATTKDDGYGLASDIEANFPSSRAQVVSMAGCQTNVSLRLADQSLIGWIGNEMVKFVQSRNGSQFFGVLGGQPVMLTKSGSDDSGYWLTGELGERTLKLPLKNNLVLTHFSTCAQNK